MGMYVVREGHGEDDALPTLIRRLAVHFQLESLPYLAKNGNWRKPLLTQAHVSAVCEQVRGRGDCEALLLTRDADNDHLPHADCPRFSAPEISDWVRALQLPFPVAVVLFYREYETLFLAGATSMAGKPIRDSRGRTVATVPTDVSAHPAPEHPRDAKGWVESWLVERYKPTLLQASLTRLLDPDDAGLAALSSFQRLVSALTFLAGQAGVAGAVYPPSPVTANA